MSIRLIFGLAVLGAATPLSGASPVAAIKCPLNAPYDPHNPFEAIIHGDSSQTVVYSDSLVMAFVPISWDTPGHVLVIPRREVRNINDIRDAEIVAVFHLIRRLAVAQQRAFGSTGYSIEQNNGRNQAVCHAHFHVIPNTPEQPVKRATPAQMQAIAIRLRAALPRS